MENWENNGVYKWDPSIGRENTFVVDTPPPTVSGSLHVGHCFSYTHTDLIVRYQRMQGLNIFYPMGWDDNGLPTERRVQNFFSVRCNPEVPYDNTWKPDPNTPVKKKEPIEISRKNFIEACAALTVVDEQAFEKLWRRLALSVDWGLTYATVDDHCRKVSQVSFIDLIEKGEAYSSERPTMWDIDFQSAIAQAELEDRDIPGAFHDLKFDLEQGGDFIISTTRPELLAACIAVVAHPDDERYQKLFGSYAVTPLFRSRVPIVASEHAEPDKGSGIMMICTFGDVADVDWWRESGLPIKQIIGRDGRILPIEHGAAPFESVDPEAANRSMGQIIGLPIKKARAKSVDLLRASGALVGEPQPITHTVKFFEKGDRPVEFIPTRQWFVRILEHKKKLLEQGRKVAWHPSFMLTRYENWVEGLNQDWCYSRQRFFGVPIPVWYPLDEQGEPNFNNPILPDKAALPVDPAIDLPLGFTEDQRNVPGGFLGDPDIMDTWATSSLTPQIMSHWGMDPRRHEQLFPMDIRPQAHDIIRTWAFVTIVKAWMHEDKIPWKNAVISGFILDPDRKKMSKSKGNVVVPNELLEEHSADVVRYWAARARLGVDTAFDKNVFAIGRKLVTKIFNASKFVIMQLDNAGIQPATLSPSDITFELDRSFIVELKKAVKKATQAFESFEYANALQVSEESFWYFCDNYLELVKTRSYSEEDTAERCSGLATLNWALQTYLRLLAPFLPYVTEEVWSWKLADSLGQPSIHRASWPRVDEVSEVPAPEFEDSFGAAVEVLGKIRETKSSAQKARRWPVVGLVIKAEKKRLSGLEAIISDVIDSGAVEGRSCVSFQEVDGPLEVQVCLQ